MTTVKQLGWLALLLGGAAHADVRLATVFSDHAVLQRNQPIVVWGWANPAEAIKLEFHDQVVKTVADAKGNWRVTLKPEAAGGPYTLQVKGDNLLRRQDILVGEVWLASGQSNMEWALVDSRDGAAEVARSDNTMIREIKVPKAVAFAPGQDIGPASWKVASPARSGEFSAVAYYFAKRLQAELKVPIGIVNASWGGTNVETWISSTAFSRFPEYGISAMPRDAAGYKARYEQRMQALAQRWQGALAVDGRDSRYWKDAEHDDAAWPALEVPVVWERQGLADFDGVVWYRKVIELSAEQAAGAATLHLGTIDDGDRTWVNGQQVGATPDWNVVRQYPVPAGLLKPGRNTIAVRVEDGGGDGGFYGDADKVFLQTAAGKVPLVGKWKARVEGALAKTSPSPNDLPTLLFNSMIRPLTDYAVRGTIWYQGESNVPRAQQYVQSFALLINDWRSQWKNPAMPFYFVQLASYLPLDKNSLLKSDWAELRDAQRQTLKLPHTGMAVATDVGDANDIHPRDKLTVGTRLALHALKNDYGQKSLIASGPVFKALKVQGAKLELSFDQVGQGLVAKASDGALKGFAVADKSQLFVPAQARIQAGKVVVWSPQVLQPVAVRYGWVDNPEQGNLFNAADLPASPFRSDAWPWSTREEKYRF